MRTIFTLLFCLLCLNASSQDIPKNDQGQAEYTGVIEVPGIKKELLQQRAVAWFNRTYQTSRCAIVDNDKESGIFTARGGTQRFTHNDAVATIDAGYFSYALTIQFKDNKAKYTINSIVYVRGKLPLEGGADLAVKFPNGWYETGRFRRKWRTMQNEADQNIRAIIQSLTDWMKSTKAKDNW